MVRAIMMDAKMIADLVEAARRDTVLWEELRKHELSIERDGTPTRSGVGVGVLVDDLVKARLGPNHGYEIGTLIVRLRYFIRIELELPV